MPQGQDVIQLTVGNNESWPAGVAAKTDPVRIIRSYEWGSILSKDGSVDGDPIVSVEGANTDNDADFVNVFEDPENPGQPLTFTMSQLKMVIRDQDFPFGYWRLNILPGTATAGNLSGEINLTQDV